MAVSIKILLDVGNTQKTVYQSDGTGYGNAIVSGKLKKETNKAASLEFVITPENVGYGDFSKMKSIVYVRYNSTYIFRGRCTDIKTDIFKQRTITCEEDIAFLADSLQPPNKRTGIENASNTKKKKRKTYYGTSGNSTSKNTIKMTPSSYFRSLINEHNSYMRTNESKKTFTIGNVTTEYDSSEETFERTSYQDTSSVISSELLSIYGGILQTRYANNTAYIDWIDEYTGTTSQKVRFGVNLVEMDEEPPSDEVWSVLLPIGDDNLTISAENSGSKYLENSAAITAYGRIVHYHKFSNCSTAAKLKRKAQKYLNSHSKVFPDNITVTAIDLKYMDDSNEPLGIGDKINVVSGPHGINKTMACIEMELDLVAPENNSYTIGTILPPDKERKKDSISSKQASTSRAGAAFANQSMAAGDALQSDMEVASNNINVNAENIAINAQNIAINAENIAIVAQNVSIAADTIDIKAQAINAELSSVDGRIRNKIEVTEQGIVATLNDMLYDEEDGLVTEYEHQLEISAEQTVETFTQTMYSGASGTGTAVDPANGTVLKAVYTKSASEWKNELWGETGSKANPANGSIMRQTADEISLKVSKDGVISSINQTSESITISASKINLSGYVTTGDLSATNSTITNLISGITTATHIKTNTLSTGAFKYYIPGSSGEGSYATLSARNVQLGTTDNNTNFYTNGYILAGSNTTLLHSHAVTVGNDGTVTLGGAVPTNSSKRSFRIADTKTYQDGVSAARALGEASVSVQSIGYYGGEYYYSQASRDYSVYVRSRASNGNVSDVTLTLDPYEAYYDGYYTGYSDGYAEGFSDGEGTDLNPDAAIDVTVSSITLGASTYDNSTKYINAVIGIALTNNRTYTTTLGILANQAYNRGYSDANATPSNVTVNYVAVYSNGSASVNVAINGSDANKSVPASHVNVYH